MKRGLLVAGVSVVLLAGACEPVTQTATLDDSMFENLYWINDGYDGVREALAADDLQAATGRAGPLASNITWARELRELVTAPGDVERARAEVPELVAMAEAARTLSQSRDLVSARAAFAELTQLHVRWRLAAGMTRVAVVECPESGAIWLQVRGPIANPYDPARSDCCIRRMEPAESGARATGE